MGDTSIEWTEKTWNPVTGCSKVSQGCKHCYAERLFPKVYPGRAFTDVQCHEDRLDAPLRVKKPTMFFVNSMSDLFHEKVPFGFIDKVFAVMALCPQHTFQILTKRPERMLEWFQRPDRPDYSKRISNAAAWYVWGQVAPIQNAIKKETCNPFKWTNYTEDDTVSPWPLSNAWLGVSVEDQKTAAERIPLLLQAPAAVRWVSYEPALGPVDFTRIRHDHPLAIKGNDTLDSLTGNTHYKGEMAGWLGAHRKLNWIVCGGESGPGARPMHPDWARSVRDQCVAAGVPFFFKQWGEWKPVRVYSGPKERLHTWSAGDFQMMERVGKHAAGRILDGRTWDEYPKVRP